MITINLLGKSQRGLALEWDINELLAGIRGYKEWQWEFEARRFEKLPYCIFGESKRGSVRYLFNAKDVVLELEGPGGQAVEVEGTFEGGDEIRVAVGDEEFDSRGLLPGKGSTLRPDKLYGMIQLAIRTATMPSPADAEAFRARLAEAVKFGRRKLLAANRIFAKVVKKVLGPQQRKDALKDFQDALKSVDFPFGGK